MKGLCTNYKLYSKNIKKEELKTLIISGFFLLTMTEKNIQYKYI